jgi:hypothetical protein
LNPTNPFAERFVVVNGGIIPVTELDADCEGAAIMGTTDASQIHDLRIDFADYLPHDGRVTIPCLPIWTGPGKTFSDNATLRVTIAYAFWHLNLKPFRRSQTFHFKSIKAMDGSQNWEVL